MTVFLVFICKFILFFLLQAVALLLAFIFYLLRDVATENPGACYFLAVVPHYLFLAAYFWTFIFGLEIILTLNANVVVNQKSKSKLVR
jgi:formate-dependent nitrite reductase membrane component NrfD